MLGKATLVVFFFPTCPYCSAAFPKVQKLYDTYRDQGLTMVWINVVPDEQKQIAPWLAKHGSQIQTNGGEPAGGRALGAPTSVPQSVLSIAAVSPA